MKDRSIAVKGRTVLLVALLGAPGFLIPCEADAAPVSAGIGTRDAVSARGETRHEGRHRRRAKGKSKPRKAVRVGEARTPRSKGRPTAAGRGRQEKLACTEAFDKAKETVRESHFRAAKELFTRCARPSCGRRLRQQCGTLHDEVVAALPSVVPVVADADIAASRDIEVKMDGESLTTNLDGSAILVDPGEHEFEFVKDGEVFATRKLDVEKRQRNLILSVPAPSDKHRNVDLSPSPVAEARAAASMAAPARAQVTDTADESAGGDEDSPPSAVRRGSSRRASVEADRKTGAPWSAYALAGVGVLGVGGYGVFNLKGRADNDALIALCKPTCDSTSVKHVRNIYLAADISLGIGVAALLASTYLFLYPDSGEEESARSRSSHISGLSIAPTPAGALATVGGTF